MTLLLAYVGLRWGEAAGLRVCDIDFLRRRAVLHENAVQVGSKMIVGTLKGHKHRTVPLPQFVVDELAKNCVGKAADDLYGQRRTADTSARRALRIHGCRAL
ncbi:tyrosine-type recombinase/integrase [Rhodococcus hoagii]|nr:tyrosine-type recombinase/integrase [Prescottella equi]